MQWFKKAEYFSLGSTVIGAGIAALTHQFVYALAPMTLTLCLNFKEQKEYQNKIERLQYQVATLHHQFDLVALPSPTEVKLLEDSLSTSRSDIFSNPKNRDRSAGWEKEITLIQRVERLELILYRLEESDALTSSRSEILSLQERVVALSQEFNLLLDKIALENNLHYSDMKSTILNESTRLTDLALAVQSEDIFIIKDELKRIKSKLQ
jgi:hypothetical protein